MPKAFIIMPFAPEFDEIYEFLIKDTLSEVGFDVIRADNLLNQENILHDIVQSTMNCDLVIADLTTSNANVFYELGLAHGFGKKCILLSQSISDVPFDLRSYRIIIYSTHFSKMGSAKSDLKRIVLGSLDGSVTFGSPVSDFGLASNLTESSTIRDHEIMINNTKKEDDKGIFDYLVDFEENMGTILTITREVGTRLSSLNPDIEQAAHLLTNERSMSFSKRKVIMSDLAHRIDAYTLWLHGANVKYKTSLEKVGNSLSIVLSGEFSIDDDSKKELVEFIKTIEEIDPHIQNGKMSMENLARVLSSLPRIEKEFNISKGKLTDELKYFIDNIEQTLSVFSRTRFAAKKLIEGEEIKGTDTGLK